MHTVNPYRSPLATDHPVRIRLYGLFPTTKGTYLKVQAAGFTLLVGLLVAWFFVRPLPMSQSILLFPWLPYIILGTAVADACELVVVLRKFREREQDAALD